MTQGRHIGYKHTEETKKKIGKSNLGKKLPFVKRRPHSEETKHKISLSSLGKQKSQTARFNMSLSRIGVRRKKYHLTPEQNLLRKSFEAQNWRKLVFMRDNFTCQYCKQTGGKLNAHHIKKWSLYPEFRYCIDNGITLCQNCHIELHKSIQKLKVKK